MNNNQEYDRMRHGLSDLITFGNCHWNYYKVTYNLMETHGKQAQIAGVFYAMTVRAHQYSFIIALAGIYDKGLKNESINRYIRFINDNKTLFKSGVAGGAKQLDKSLKEDKDRIRKIESVVEHVTTWRNKSIAHTTKEISHKPLSIIVQ